MRYLEVGGGHDSNTYALGVLEVPLAVLDGRFPALLLLLLMLVMIMMRRRIALIMLVLLRRGLRVVVAVVVEGMVRRRATRSERMEVGFST